MPQRDSIVVLTAEDAEVVTAATNNDHVKNAIKVLTTQIADNSATMKGLRNGPKSADEFKLARDAASQNLELMKALPESEEKNTLIGDLERALALFEEGLSMHGHGN